MLAKMFSGELPPSQKDSSGRFFIDRDGSRFATILAFLRGELVEIPASVKERAAFAADAAFYQVCLSSHQPPLLLPRVNDVEISLSICQA